MEDNNWVSFFLLCKDSRDLDLRPHELRVLHLISQYEPRSSSDDPLDEVAIVPSSDVILHLILILLRWLDYEVVREAHLPTKITVVVGIKRRFEPDYPTEYVFRTGTDGRIADHDIGVMHVEIVIGLLRIVVGEEIAVVVIPGGFELVSHDGFFDLLHGNLLN